MPRINPDLPLVTAAVYRLMLRGEFLGQETQNTFYWLQLGEPTVQPTPAQFWNLVSPHMLTEYLASVSTAWRGTEARVDRFDLPTASAHVASIDNLFGTVAGDPCPSYVSARLRRLTDTAGQKGRGMVRIPGIVETSTDGNLLIAPQLTAIRALGTALAGDIDPGDPEAGTFASCLATRTIGPGPVYDAEVHAGVIEDWIVNPVLGTSRSRLQERAS